MGNCLARNASRGSEKQEQKVTEEGGQLLFQHRNPPGIPAAAGEGKPRKTVTFRLHDHKGEEEASSRVTRIRVVLKRDELKQILEGGGPAFSPSERLLSAIVKQGESSRDTDELGGWKPSLEMVPEDVTHKVL